MKKFFSLLVAASALASCSSDEPIINQVNNLYPYKEIIERANYYYNKLPGRTRSHIPQIASVSLINNVTRTDNEENPMYYIVNYEENSGFAIVGGNEYSRPLIAISDESALDQADINDIPPLQSFIKNSSYLESATDTLDHDRKRPFNISILPKLNRNVRMWGQSYPFNTYTPLIDGQHTLVGCVPLATAMMMSYYEWPETHKGRSLNWSSLKNGYSDDLAFLLAELGEPENLYSNYGLDATSTNFYRVPYTMKNYDYTYERSDIDLYNIIFLPNEDCKANTNKMLPLLMVGYGYKKDEPSYTGGHAWVIDGLLHIPYDPDNKIDPNYSPDAYFLHCVWGWFGKANGYFLADGVSSIGGDRHSKDPGDKIYPGHGDSESPYFFNNGIWGYYGFKKDRPSIGEIIVGPPIVKPDLP